MRLFVAVDLSTAVREAVSALLARERIATPSARWTGDDKVHVTLVFLGNVADEVVDPMKAALAEVVARHPPLSLHTRGAGSFGSARHPKVLWLGLEGDVAPLAALQRELEAAFAPFGHQPEHRDFRPHLTLARSKQPRGDPQLAASVERLAGVDLGASRIDEVTLYQSQLSPKGAHYTALLRAPLCG